MNSKMIRLLREEFEKVISKKTGWGKVEVMRALETAIADASLKLLDEMEAGNNKTKYTQPVRFRSNGSNKSSELPWE